MRKTKTSYSTIIVLSSVVLGAVASLAACEGPEGPAGPAGAPNTQAGAPGPAGATGPAGPTGMAAPAVDGGLTTSCMLPCHGFNGIVEQWKTSTHFFGAIENLEEEAAWTNPNSTCGNCHATDGLPARLAGNYKISGADAGPINASKGQLNYNRDGGAAEIGFGGKSAVAIIGCVTCHDAVTNDPHVTGGVYTKGDFKLRMPSGPNDEAYIEKSPTVGTFTGTPAGKWGVSNTCIACHKSRKDVTNYITASNTISTNWGPHISPVADIFSGKGGYHFGNPDNLYTNSSHQTLLPGCGGCHLPKVTLNNNYPDHTFRTQKATCTEGTCHGGSQAILTSTINTATGNYNAAMRDLQKALNRLGFLTRGNSLALTSAQLADNDFAADRGKSPGRPATADEAGALYNYFSIARAGQLFVHNPFYVKQLIWDSYQKVKDTGAGDPTNPTGITARP